MVTLVKHKNLDILALEDLPVEKVQHSSRRAGDNLRPRTIHRTRLGLGNCQSRGDREPLSLELLKHPSDLIRQLSCRSQNQSLCRVEVSVQPHQDVEDESSGFSGSRLRLSDEIDRRVGQDQRESCLLNSRWLPVVHECQSIEDVLIVTTESATRCQ